MAKKARLPASALAFFREQGARGGRLGRKALLEKMTPAQRIERARKAGLASARARRKKD